MKRALNANINMCTVISLNINEIDNKFILKTKNQFEITNTLNLLLRDEVYISPVR